MILFTHPGGRPPLVPIWWCVILIQVRAPWRPPYLFWILLNKHKLPLAHNHWFRLTVFWDSRLYWYMYDVSVYLTGTYRYPVWRYCPSSPDTIYLLLTQSGYPVNCIGSLTHNLRPQVILHLHISLARTALSHVPPDHVLSPEATLPRHLSDPYRPPLSSTPTRSLFLLHPVLPISDCRAAS